MVTDFHVGFPIFLAEMLKDNLFILHGLEGSISSMLDMQDLCNSGAGGMWGRGSSGHTRLHGVKIMPGSFAVNAQMPKGTKYQELKRRQWERMSQDSFITFLHPPPLPSPVIPSHSIGLGVGVGLRCKKTVLCYIGRAVSVVRGMSCPKRQPWRRVQVPCC